MKLQPPRRQGTLCLLFFSILVSALMASDPMMPDPELRADLQHRRSAIEKEIGPNSILIVFSTPEKNKTNDVDYPYRQQNNLYYLSGITQPDTTLVLFPGNTKRKEFLFISDRDPKKESWTGKILSHDEAKTISGIQNVYSNKQWETFVDSVLQGNEFDVDRYNPSHEYDEFFADLRKGDAHVYLVFEKRPGLNGELTPEYVFANKLKERFLNASVKDAWPMLLHMRQVKSEYEIKMLRRAVDISCDAHLSAWKAAKPGLWEYQMQSALEAVYKNDNADWGYPSIVASGPNATTLHYETSQRQMQNGDLLLIDAGAEYNYYTADVTRTFPINGKFTPEQAAIYQIVLDAQDACFKMAHAGAKLPEIHLKSVEVIKEGLKKLGLITDTTGDQYKMFYLHGVGHWLGLDVHDAGERWRPAEPGTVFTLEPGIYIRADALDNLEKTPENDKLIAAIRPAFEKYKNIGVRIEDDVLITKNGYENLSAKLPRKIEDIENFLGRR